LIKDLVSDSSADGRARNKQHTLKNHTKRTFSDFLSDSVMATDNAVVRGHGNVRMVSGRRGYDMRGRHGVVKVKGMGPLGGLIRKIEASSCFGQRLVVKLCGGGGSGRIRKPEVLRDFHTLPAVKHEAIQQHKSVARLKVASPSGRTIQYTSDF
jgi:hypothetical protein